MFVINEDKSIYITRGDVAFFSIEAKTDTGEKYKFMPGDVVRFKVCERKACENVVLSKDFGIETEAEEVSIYLEEKDTKFGEVISKPVEYWYEVELNPYTDPQTILGYDEDGAKVFKLFPEGNEKEDDDPITPEDIPVVDAELDLTSTRPVQNQAIARAFLKINEDIDARMSVVEDEAEKLMGEIREGSIDYLTDAKGNKVTNVADPTENGDAVNLGYAREYFGVRRRGTPQLTQVTPGVFKVEDNYGDSALILSARTQIAGYICNPYYDGYDWHIKITNAETGEPADVDSGFLPLVIVYVCNYLTYK